MVYLVYENRTIINYWSEEKEATMRIVQKQININALSGPDRVWLKEEIERITGYQVIGHVFIAAIVDEDKPVYQMHLPIQTEAICA